MKFRYKVLITNLILLSVSLGLVGYLMIHKNFELAKETQISNAVIQNNLVQSSVEYEVLQALNREESVKGALPDIGAQVSSGMRAENVTFFIYYGDKLVYNETEENANLKKVWEAQQEDGNKNYAIFEEDGHYYIYVAPASKVGDENLCMISRSDVSDAYALRDREIRYFRLILFICLMIESLLIYVISRYLTRPLEQLNRVAEEITDGSYETRITVKSQDEVGLLAENFNRMAEAVSEKIGELQGMVRKRDQFVADFTHEIKTPMTSIIGYADTMRSMELPREEQLLALSYIFSEGRRLERMSGKLFDLIYLREHEMEKEAVQVENVSSEVLKVVTPSLDTKKLVLKENIEPAVLYGNKELLVVLTGIFLPGILIEGQERKAVGEVQAVPAQYIASDSLLAKEASESLKLNDRIQLITGQWESETQEAYSYEMTLKDYEAAALARDSMEAIYQQGQYPSDLASSYANWYTWEAFPEKAVDTTFHTYSAYYWKLIFTKYDGTETHTVFLLEDGTVLLAEAEGKDILSDVTATEEAFSSVKDNEEEKTVEKELAEQLSYTGLDVAGLRIKSDNILEEKEVKYRYFELYDKTRFIYGISTTSDSQTKHNMVK